MKYQLRHTKHWDILADRLNNPSYTIPPKNTSNDDRVSDLDD